MSFLWGQGQGILEPVTAPSRAAGTIRPHQAGAIETRDARNDRSSTGDEKHAHRHAESGLALVISGACDTRETILKRDGTGVVTNASCAATSGSWYSPYDGATWSAASDVDIDHLVPLAEAWDSGAYNWSAPKREQFANDRTRPQLLAVTDNVNQSKSDQDPGTWWPSRTAYKCTYARAWVQVKHYYGLTVDLTEKSALSSVLNGC